MAIQHGNPARDLLGPFGDTPTGRYGIVKSAKLHNLAN